MRTGIAAGLDIDDFAPRLSFFWGIGMNHFMEIAKMRAARVLWAKIIKSFNPKNPKSMALRDALADLGLEPDGAGCLQQRDAHLRGGDGRGAGPYAVAAHQRAGRSASRCPRDFSARIARNTQIYLQEETGITKVVDPWAGSYYVESAHARTDAPGVASHSGDRSARRDGEGDRDRHCRRCASKRPRRGGRRRSIPAGKSSSASTSTRLDDERALDVLEVDNQAVREIAVAAAGARSVRPRRQSGAGRARGADPARPRRGRGNLLELAVDAARVRATLGEISGALEKVFGRYQAVNRTISGVYSSESQDDPEFQKARAHGGGVRASGRPASADPGREDGPGRPRSRGAR